MTYLEEEYELARMECWLARAMGDRPALRDAIKRAWYWRVAIRLSDRATYA
jgi:hypothetical protein